MFLLLFTHTIVTTLTTLNCIVTFKNTFLYNNIPPPYKLLRDQELINHLQLPHTEQTTLHQITQQDNNTLI